MTLVFLTMFGFFFVVSQLFQLVLGYGPFESGSADAADHAGDDRRRAGVGRRWCPALRRPHDRDRRHVADRGGVFILSFLDGQRPATATC